MAEHSNSHISVELLGLAVLASHRYPFQTGVPSCSQSPAPQRCIPADQQ